MLAAGFAIATWSRTDSGWLAVGGVRRLLGVVPPRGTSGGVFLRRLIDRTGASDAPAARISAGGTTACVAGGFWLRGGGDSRTAASRPRAGRCGSTGWCRTGGRRSSSSGRGRADLATAAALATGTRHDVAAPQEAAMPELLALLGRELPAADALLGLGLGRSNRVTATEPGALTRLPWESVGTITAEKISSPERRPGRARR